MGAEYSGWLLSVDFGTSNTAAGHIDEATGTARTLPLSYNGNLMPSVAYVHASGQIDVGEIASHAAAGDPRGYLPAPRQLLTLGLTTFDVGEWAVPAHKVVAAILRSVLARALPQHYGRMPDGLVLTHPEGWNGRQIRVLIDAAVEVGCPPHLVRTVSEPHATAHFYAGHREINMGERIAVFDFGGGTLDVAVLVADADGSFEVTTARSDKALGGRDFDAAIRRWVDSELSQRNSVLMGVSHADSTTRQQRALDDSIRQAKEMLSETSRAVIDVYGGSRRETLLLERTALESLIAQEVTRAAQLARSTFGAAGIERDDLSAICLTGGSSRIPLVQQQIRELGPITTLDDPKTVVARGALVAARRHVTAPPQQAAPRYPAPAPFPPPEPFAADRPPTPAPPAPRPPTPEQPSGIEPPPLPEPPPQSDNYAAEPHSDPFARLFALPGEFAEPDFPTEHSLEDYPTPAPLFPGADDDPWSSGTSGSTPLGGRGRPVGTGGRLPWRTILLVVALLVGGVIAVALVGTHNPQSHPVQTGPPAAGITTTTTSTTTKPPSTSCTGEAGAGTTDLPGGQTTPIDVVNALQYAYYMQRDPAAVIALYAPNTLTDAGKQQIASFITSIPTGTAYCVTATQGADPLTVNYDVTETRPNAAANRYRMYLKVCPTAPYQIVTLGRQK